jgi:2-polyprenyl-6-hydroxyphenyl methylase/3-demethylubiquinone-9 3-methyltransferase
MSSKSTGVQQRFAFGENWRLFLSRMSEERIRAAEESLTAMLGRSDLHGMRFLDVGCGSGLFSLAARRLGATVHSFDLDSQSVACTEELRRRYAPSAEGWTIETGSLLDEAFLSRLGQFDVVYCWGVAHHTGAMWTALANLPSLVRTGGYLYLAIYNTQVPWTALWTVIKRLYNLIPTPLRIPYTLAAILPVELAAFIYFCLVMNPAAYFRRWTRYSSRRGMDRWRDIVDWVGGYPFETARPEEIFDFYRHRGFVLERLKTCGGRSGCNEFVFRLPPTSYVPNPSRTRLEATQPT